jgi:acyl transferase domain-containing protein
VALQAVGVLSESGYAHPFDEHSEGMGRAEGVGCVVLRRMGDAHRDGNQIVATLINAAVGAAGPSEGQPDDVG